MNSQIDLCGASGTIYRYRIANPVRPNIAGSGNFVYVRDEDGAAQVVFAGETDSLALDSLLRWDEAVRQHGATHLFMRLNVSGATRACELSDLLPALDPVMNQPVQAARAA
jgi:hypothetical protein